MHDVVETISLKLPRFLSSIVYFFLKFSIVIFAKTFTLTHPMLFSQNYIFLPDNCHENNFSIFLFSLSGFNSTHDRNAKT
jgi:hypothetical protein